MDYRCKHRKLLQNCWRSHLHGVKLYDLDEDNNAIINVVAHRVTVSLIEGTLHGRLIEEGNIYVNISSIVLEA